tara:strand:- start:4757 stop:5725 length:969 start_codon:yes stop_codon:yes gene_type:complete
MTLLNPWALLLLPMSALPFVLKGSQGQLYSWLTIAPKDQFSKTADFLLNLITALLIAALVLALTGPRGGDQVVQKVGKGAQTVMVIDRSVSMEHPFAGDVINGQAGEVKSAAARRLLTDFVQSRPDDMVGVVAFTNSALYGLKITTNRDAIYSAINAATSSGVNQTNIGAGVTQGASLFDQIESSGSRAVILLSDGAGKVSPRVKLKLKKEMEAKGLSLYWIVLREPDGLSIFTKKVYTEDTTPAPIALDNYFKSLKIKYKAYEADNPTTLQSAIQDINAREKKTIQYEVTIAGRDYSTHFIIIAGIISLLILIAKNLRIYQ